MNFLKSLTGFSVAIFSSMYSSVSVSQTVNNGTWLDQTTNWNSTEMSIPPAPVTEGGNNLGNCPQSIRTGFLKEDKLLESAGWTLTGSVQIYGATTIITGMADADGMCRPLNYQVFVFTNGEFSGTLSPTPMNSRTDGSLIDVQLYREGLIGASFNRYTPEDALCCASAKSSLLYEVELQDNKPVVVPQLPADTI